MPLDDNVGFTLVTSRWVLEAAATAEAACCCSTICRARSCCSAICRFTAAAHTGCVSDTDALKPDAYKSAY